MGSKEVDRRPISLGETALWDDRLEVEVNAAITRGDRTVPAGLALISSEDENKL